MRMTGPQFPLIDAREILRVVGGAAFTRGKGYASSEHISGLAWDAESSELSGRVQGSERQPYQTRVRLADKKGAWTIADPWCTCPVGTACKHTAALMILSNTLHLQAKDVVYREPEPAPGWHQSLNSLLGAGTTAKPARSKASARPRGGDETPDPIQPLALQFDVQDSQLSAHRGWAPGSSAGRQRPTRRFRLGVRPMVRSGNGRWVRGNLRWNTISFKTYGLNLDEEQHRWFCQFVPLYRANGQLYFGEDNDWIYLDDFSSPLLWTLLDEARRLGINFLGLSPVESVRIDAPASVSLAVERVGAGADGSGGADDGGLGLSPHLELDGESLAVAANRPMGAIGDHGVYALRGSSLSLAPTDHRLNPAEQEMLRSPERIDIPAADVDEFMRRVYPRLGRRVAVSSADPEVRLPRIEPPRLILDVDYTGEDRAALDWSFDYAGTPVDAETRDAEAEQRLEDAALAALADTPLAGNVLVPRTLKGLETVDFMRRALPALEALEDTEVRTHGEAPEFRELTESPELTVTAVESDKRDWFDLGLMIRIGELSMPFADVLRALSRGQARMLMPDRTYFSLEHPLFDKLRALVAEAAQLADRKSDELRITRYQASLWEELDALAANTEGPDSWYAGVGSLLDFSESGPLDLPAGLDASLRPYQVDGFRWLGTLWQNGLGGVLADDMGLGKTLQTLALMLHAKQTWAAAEAEGRGPRTDVAATTTAADANLPGAFLVVAPTSVVGNWADEARRFAPDLRVATVTDTQPRARVKLRQLAAENDVVITSYTLFRLDDAAYQEQTWAGLILDEAQFVKNKATKAHHAARDLNARFKLAITGTPMENNLMELWSIFAIVSPGLFPSALRFAEHYQRPIERQGLDEPRERLRRRVRPFMLRRTKDAVVTDLPPKQEQVLHVELAPKHRKVYDTHLQRERQKILRLVDDMDKNRFTIFQSLTLLRMLALDASLVDPEYDGVASSKLDMLFEQLEDVFAEGHRALVFSQFTSFLKKAADRLEAEEVPYVYLDGSTRNRPEVINRFKEGQAPVFLISLKAGGFGLNLTEADYCFLLDPWWNPAAESQAVDRAHRIGQTRSVMVYRMVAKDTIEDKVVALQDAKRRLISSVMDEGDGFGSVLSADDIRDLLND